MGVGFNVALLMKINIEKLHPAGPVFEELVSYWSSAALSLYKFNDPASVGWEQYIQGL